MSENVIGCSDRTVELAGAPKLTTPSSTCVHPREMGYEVWARRADCLDCSVIPLQGQELKLHRVHTHGSRVPKN